MEIYNIDRCIIYNEWPAQKQNIMTTWQDKNHITYWSFITQLITVFTMIYTYTHIHIFLTNNKGYDARINQQGNLEAYTSTLK